MDKRIIIAIVVLVVIFSATVPIFDAGTSIVVNPDGSGAGIKKVKHTLFQYLFFS